MQPPPSSYSPAPGGSSGATETATKPRRRQLIKESDVAEGARTLAGAYAKIEAHEDLCAERYGNIHTAIADLKRGNRWVISLVVGLVVGLVGWMAVQLYALEPLRMAASKPAPAPAAQSQTP